MTRAEARKQTKTGWISRGLAAILMGFDLDVKRLDFYTKNHVVEVWKRNGVERFRLEDILRVTESDLTELLDKYLPVNRQKKGTRRQHKLILATREQQDEFHRRWFRIHRRVSSLIANPKEKFDNRELRLITQLMQLSRRVSNFELVLTAQKLMEATGLDDEWLPKTRRRLQGRRLIDVEKNGTVEWVYTLLDPEPSQASAETVASRTAVFPADGWLDVRESPKNTVPANDGVDA